MRISHITFGLLGALLIAPILRGADDPVPIREVYWQVLPVGWVSGWLRRVPGE